MGDLRTPVRVAIWMVLLNVALNALCVVGLGLDVAGLSLSTAITTWINVAWLGRGLHTRLGLPAPGPELRGRAARIALAALACALAAWAAQRGTASALGFLEARRSIPALLVGLGAGGLAFACAAHALSIPEWHEIRQRLGKLWTRGAGS
jgi:peptidoglycan biosynthesis protein MviN/MurJ (putative lipid II flippase)